MNCRFAVPAARRRGFAFTLVVGALAMCVMSATQASPPELVHLATFETPGFSPDDVAYDPTGGPRLVAVTNGLGRGIYELTLTGELLAYHPLRTCLQATPSRGSPVAVA